VERNELGSSPASFHEQPVDARERLNTSLYCTLETFGRIGVGKACGRLHGRQHVLGSVLGFASEIDDLSLVPFALRYVASDLRCADDLASSVSDRRNGQRNVDQTPVLALPNGFKRFDALAASNSLNDRFFLFLVTPA
jgi:hypothetical protein